MNRLTFFLLLLVAFGCGDDPASDRTQREKVGLPAGVLLAKAPDNPVDIAAIKKTAKEGDRLTLRGQVGGGKHPFIKGRSVMLMADLAMLN